MPNKISFEVIGHTGKDASFNYTNSGTPVWRCSVAYNDGAKTKYEKTIWFNLVAFGKVAEKAATLDIRKGNPICVKGIPSLNKWKAMDGTQVADLQVRVFKVQKGVWDDDANSYKWVEGQEQVEPEEVQEEMFGDDDDDDDVPF